jgi:type IV secretory pathway VirB4 component
MPQHSSEASIRIAVDDWTSIGLDVEIPLDELYRSVAHKRRRAVLYTIARRSVPIDLHTIAREVAIQEQPDNAEPVTVELTEEVRTSLYHTHLPKLAELGLIEFDPEEMAVESIAGTVKPVSA